MTIEKADREAMLINLDSVQGFQKSYHFLEAVLLVTRFQQHIHIWIFIIELLHNIDPPASQQILDNLFTDREVT